MQTILVHFQFDLRLRDNPALRQAALHADHVVPVFIWDPAVYGDWTPGRGQRWWLRHSLRSLRDDLRQTGSDLLIREGDTGDILREVVIQTAADGVYWNQSRRPHIDQDLHHQRRDALDEATLELRQFDPTLMHDPESVETTSGGPYHVYTPFWNRFLDVVTVDEPVGVPDLQDVPPPDSLDTGRAASELRGLDHDTDHYEGRWLPSETAGRDRLQSVIDRVLIDYHNSRERPDTDGSSRLSPYLRSGQLTPRQVWHAVIDAFDLTPEQLQADDPDPAGPITFLQELVWREFAYHLLHHYPETTHTPLKDKFRAFDWRHDPSDLRHWQRGETGFPIVDAGIRQLHRHGWIHNRVRMVVASFLTKDLLIPWQRGADHFWDLLVDADLANNTLGWQWAAGCGADAQPFFRMFNPVRQAEKHDPNGDYIRNYVPELSDLPTDLLHAPWRADEATLRDHNITLGKDYPHRIVDHQQARDRALEHYNRVK